MGPAITVIEDVEMTRGADGAVSVTWKVTGDCDTVDLAWGRSADGLDHVHVTTMAAAGRAAVIDAAVVGAGRVYVSVAPAGRPGGTAGTVGPGATIAGERRIGLHGPVNFRDLGGYRTSGGRAVRWGRLFRSDALRLDEHDLAEFADLGIRTVYDLRSEAERRTVPNRLPSAHAPVEVALPLVTVTDGASPLERLSYADGETFLEQLYLHILESSAANFGRIVTGLAVADELPAVFHCAAGKDRTGLVAAVVLSVLGVAAGDVLDDYELTGRYRTNEHVSASMARLESTAKVTPEMAAGILRAPRWALQSVLDQVGERYGSFDGYLTGPAGAARDIPGRLRDRLLTSLP